MASNEIRVVLSMTSGGMATLISLFLSDPRSDGALALFFITGPIVLLPALVMAGLVYRQMRRWKVKFSVIRCGAVGGSIGLLMASGFVVVLFQRFDIFLLLSCFGFGAVGGVVFAWTAIALRVEGTRPTKLPIET